MASQRLPNKILLNIKNAGKTYKVFGYIGPTGSGKLEALKQALDLPVTDFYIEFQMNMNNIEMWCKRFLASSLFGPVIKVVKNAELITDGAIAFLQKYVKKNKTDTVILVGCEKLGKSLPVVYHPYLSIEFRELVAITNSCPANAARLIAGQCDQDLRQIAQHSHNHQV